MPSKASFSIATCDSCALTTSPRLISPISFSPSSTGIWRNRPSVIVCRILPTLSWLVQVTSLRVIYPLTFSSRHPPPDLPNSRTISRSDKIPSACSPSDDTTTVPIRRSDNNLAASEMLASGDIVTTPSLALDFRIK